MSSTAESRRLPSHECSDEGLDPQTKALYVHVLHTLLDGPVAFLVGGAYALARYAGIVRHTKDLDVFVRPQDAEAALKQLAGAGFQTEMSFPHWLGKAYAGDDFVDVIFCSGNGLVRVGSEWFEHAVPMEVLGVPVRLCPPEETIWSKAFVQERERFDGADVAHLLRATAADLDWPRLIRRFGPHWRVLAAHLILFGYIYPSERSRIPADVMDQIVVRLQEESQCPPASGKLCQGPFLSREQYLIDISAWGYRDARLPPTGDMSAGDIAHWTAAIGK